MTESVFIDATPLGGGISGAGRYSYELLDALLPMTDEMSMTVLVPPAENRNWDISHWKQIENVKFQLANLRGVGPKRQLYYLRHSFDFDLFHSLSSYSPLFVDGPIITTIHDLKYLKVPSYFEGQSFLKYHYVAAMIRRSARISETIITVSESTRSDLEDECNVSREKLSVIPLGPGDVQSEIDGSPPVSPPYFFFVGELRPHKNVQTLIKGYNQFREQIYEPDIDLVIAGTEYGDRHSELKRSVKDSYRENVLFLGRVTDDELAQLYEHATAFVFPSLYEGFGLPPLEAMGYGTPVIASNKTSIPEVVGDAGLYFDPENEIEICRSMQSILSDDELYAELEKKGRKRFEDFSWNRTARETLQIYRETLNCSCSDR
jgi:glycosyltransferase involved in cell wall biosynthesis